MTYGTIVTVLSDWETDRNALNAAADLARRQEAHLDVICLGVDRTQPGFYYAGATTMAIQSNIEAARKDAAELAEKVTELLSGESFPWAAPALAAATPGLAATLAYRTRMADLAVQAPPYGEGRDFVNETIVESALFDADLPVLVVPDGHSLPERYKTAVIAWNESQNALRAVRAALPELKQADNVNVVVVDPPVHMPDEEDPGVLLCQMLSRHGVHAEVTVLPKSMPRVSDVLARHVEEIGADLLVMGAYGHSRFRESILGGATRNTLASTKVPVFMAH